MVMEVTQAGVRTRARAMVAEETEDNSEAVKRRKVGNEKLRSPSLTSENTKTRCDINYVKSAHEEEYPSDSFNASANLKSGGVPASCCSSTGSMEKVKVADLEKSYGTETSAYKLNGSESTPKKELKAESGELESCTAKPSLEMVNPCRTVLSPEKMPPEVELEAFFAAAEEDLNKQFKEKYNYDVVNDIPLKGRYDWVELTPGK
ncbi:unnamed protein product [Lactuca saligna]|uniref:Cyclin-dependent kinase inhibitor n=1 Tax=Lactuca saligna TaxID=75948 RepID=A0AA35YDW0_LACSI|nr:unnamed protein product [Lactuca saligna]